MTPENSPTLLASFSRLLTKDGLVAAWPGRKGRTALEQVLAAFAWARLQRAATAGDRFSESEITELLRTHAICSSAADAVLLRRLLFESGLLGREDDGSSYWINPATSSNAWTLDTNWVDGLNGTREPEKDVSSLIWEASGLPEKDSD